MRIECPQTDFPDLQIALHLCVYAAILPLFDNNKLAILRDILLENGTGIS